MLNNIYRKLTLTKLFRNDTIKYLFDKTDKMLYYV